MRRLLLLGAVALCASCALPQPLQSGLEDGPGSKVVAGKEEPVTLVALDGTRCIVPLGRFERTRPGDRVWCDWRPRGAR
jgi:hypothetical protein